MNFPELNVNAHLNDNYGDVQPRHVQAHCQCRSAPRGSCCAVFEKAWSTLRRACSMEMLGFMILTVAESSGLASSTSADSHSYDSLTHREVEVLHSLL